MNKASVLDKFFSKIETSELFWRMIKKMYLYRFQSQNFGSKIWYRE